MMPNDMMVAFVALADPARRMGSALTLSQHLPQILLGVLVAIFACVLLVALVRSRRRAVEASEAPSDAPEATESTEPTTSVPAKVATEEGALVAAITAAVAVYLDTEAAKSGTTASGFRVVSFRKRARVPGENGEHGL